MRTTVRRTQCISVLETLKSQTKLAYVIFLFGDIVCLETKNMMSVPLMRLDGRGDSAILRLSGNVFAVEISQVALSGTERRIWREDLAPVDVLMTATAVAMAGFG